MSLILSFLFFLPSVVTASSRQTTDASLNLLYSARAACSASARPYFLVLVHSSASASDRRQLIRATWGSVGEARGKTIAVVFVMGTEEGENGTEIQSANATSTLTPQSKVAAESEQFGDIVQGNFSETEPFAQTQKHLLGFRWLSIACPRSNWPAFVVKASDSVLLEVFHLSAFSAAIYGDARIRRTLACDVVPAGISVGDDGHENLAEASKTVREDNGGEARLSEEDSRDHCNEMAYIITPDLAEDIVNASRYHPQANTSSTSEYLLGYLPSLLNVSLSVLNPKFLRPEQSAQLGHLLDGGGHAPLPYIFVGLDTARTDWRLDYERLWNITSDAQRGQR